MEVWGKSLKIPEQYSSHSCTSHSAEHRDKDLSKYEVKTAPMFIQILQLTAQSYNDFYSSIYFWAAFVPCDILQDSLNVPTPNLPIWTKCMSRSEY